MSPKNLTSFETLIGCVSKKRDGSWCWFFFRWKWIHSVFAMENLKPFSWTHLWIFLMQSCSWRSTPATPSKTLQKQKNDWQFVALKTPMKKKASSSLPSVLMSGVRIPTAVLDEVKRQATKPTIPPKPPSKKKEKPVASKKASADPLSLGNRFYPLSVGTWWTAVIKSSQQWHSVCTHYLHKGNSIYSLQIWRIAAIEARLTFSNKQSRANWQCS